MVSNVHPVSTLTGLFPRHLIATVGRLGQRWATGATLTLGWVAQALAPTWAVVAQLIDRWTTALLGERWSVGRLRDMIIQSSSLAYVAANNVQGKVSGAYVDPTTDTVKFAFLPDDVQPTPSDWVAGSWETEVGLSGPVYNAICLVGPGGTITLSPGTYRTYIQVIDNPEIPVLFVDLLQVN